MLQINPSLPAAAGGLPNVDAPLLTVSGNVGITNSSDGARLDLAYLKSLPKTTIRTTTPWTQGEKNFEGVLMRDLFAALKAKGSKISASAIDDYGVEIPWEDIDRYDVVLVYSIDGQPLPSNDKGPLWIVYPFSQHADLNKDVYFSRSVWQLERLIVE